MPSGKYVYAPYSSTLDVGTGDGFTVEAWIKRYDNNPGPLFQWDSPSGQGVTLWANYETVGGLFGVIMEADGQGHVTGIVNALPLNEFVHVALTYEASSGDTKIYTNGVLARTTNYGLLGPLKTAMNFSTWGTVRRTAPASTGCSMNQRCTIARSRRRILRISTPRAPAANASRRSAASPTRWIGQAGVSQAGAAPIGFVKLAFSLQGETPTLRKAVP
jgi:hypothetical protein